MCEDLKTGFLLLYIILIRTTVYHHPFYQQEQWPVVFSPPPPTKIIWKHACIFNSKNLPIESFSYKWHCWSNSVLSLNLLFSMLLLLISIYFYTNAFKKFFFDVLYLTLLHLMPLRFHCVGGCWDWTLQDCCDLVVGSQTLYHSARSHPHISIYICSFVSDDEPNLIYLSVEWM